jgi:chromosomal replication initiation ATPase DnaA
MAEQKPQRRLFHDVKREVCAEFNITAADFDGPSRTELYVWARRRAWWLGATICGRSQSALAQASGGKCPSTVYHGLQEYKKVMEQGDELGFIRAVMERRKDRPANGSRARHNAQRDTRASRTDAGQGVDCQTD